VGERWWCPQEISFIRMLSSKQFLYALLTYLLVALPKDILIDNKKISDNFTSFTACFVCKRIQLMLNSKLYQTPKWNGSVYALHMRLGVWGMWSMVCKSTELLFLSFVIVYNTGCDLKHCNIVFVFYYNNLKKI
jgi:hypothetical protein